jgi:hypothetical protein
MAENLNASFLGEPLWIFADGTIGPLGSAHPAAHVVGSITTADPEHPDHRGLGFVRYDTMHMDWRSLLPMTRIEETAVNLFMPWTMAASEDPEPLDPLLEAEYVKWRDAEPAWQAEQDRLLASGGGPDTALMTESTVESLEDFHKEVAATWVARVQDDLAKTLGLTMVAALHVGPIAEDYAGIAAAMKALHDG